MMKRILAIAPVLMAVVLAAGCDDDDDDVTFQPAQLALRVLHASPDAPKVNVIVDGDAVLEGVDYKTGSAFRDLDEGSYDIAVEGIIPGGNATVIDLPDTNLDGDTDYSVIAVGKVGDATLEPLVIANPQEPLGAGNIRAQVVHAAPGAPAVDVYVTAPGADLGAETPLGSFSFKEELGPVEVPAGDYQIRVTLAGDAASVVFDSGALPLDAGADLLIVAVENTGTGDAPISLVALDGAGSAEILDVSTPADVRVVHASPDAPPVDVIVNDDFGSPPVSGLAYPDVAPGADAYLAVPADAYNFKVAAAGTNTVVLDFDATLAAGKAYTVLATGLLADISQLILADDNRRVATEAKVRLVHASPAAGEVDIYVVDEADTDITDDTAAFAAVPFQADTGYVPLGAGDYRVVLTPAGDSSQVALDVTVTVQAGGVYTAVARDAAGGGASAGLILLDDFAG
jgi:hypothetical protein